ncbi:MAG: heme ABC transporter ATP-binding protein [Calditrichaeota bacterium]|nr:heme ABC transporter ATP-binding protein [Calditrichota bacterium]
MLKTENLHFSYTDNPFIENVSIAINDGEYVGIIGPNGSGKSTLIKIFAGLIAPQAGQVHVQANNISNHSRKQIAKLMAYVPQTVEISFDFIVRDVVAMGRFPHSQNLLVKDNESLSVVDQVIKKVHLEKLQYRNFSELSGGEKQRVVIASAIAQQTDLILLDEPTSALDLRHQQEIYMLLKKLTQNESKTVVVVTHDINLAAQYCDRLILLNNGKVIKDGTPDEVLKFPVIQDVYGVKVYIDINPFTKSLYILPYDLQ